MRLEFIYQFTKPAFLGTKVFEKYPLKTLINYIDWTPFFITWQLAGKYPDILSDKTVGKAATDLFNDAQKVIKKNCRRKFTGSSRDRGFLAGK